MRTTSLAPLIALLAVMTPALAPRTVLASDMYVANKDVRLDPARKPAPGKALIYFVRTQTMGFAVKVKLYADDRFLGIVGSKTFVSYECDPGAHHFAGVAENAGLLDAEVAADTIYVVQVSIHMGAWKARTHFEVARKASEALDEYRKSKSDLAGITTTDAGRKWADEDATTDAEKMVKYREKGEVETLKPADGWESLP